MANKKKKGNSKTKSNNSSKVKAEIKPKSNDSTKSKVIVKVAKEKKSKKGKAKNNRKEKKDDSTKDEQKNEESGDEPNNDVIDQTKDILDQQAEVEAANEILIEVTSNDETQGDTQVDSIKESMEIVKKPQKKDDLINEDQDTVGNSDLELTNQMIEVNGNTSPLIQEDSQVSLKTKVNELQLEVYRLKDTIVNLTKELTTLKDNESKLKSGLHCSICVNFYHVPHTLECGHTFCFSCIRAWLDRLDKNKSCLNCPLCRVAVKKSPNFVFPLHQHILETLSQSPDQHVLAINSIKEHFSNFNKEISKWGTIFPECGLRSAIFDIDDDVRRCTRCNWEVVGRDCANCGTVYSGDSEPSNPDSDTTVSDTGSVPFGSTWRTSSSRGVELGSDQEDSADSDGEGESLGHASQDELDAELDQEQSEVDSFVCEDDQIDYESDANPSDIEPSGPAFISGVVISSEHDTPASANEIVDLVTLDQGLSDSSANSDHSHKRSSTASPVTKSKKIRHIILSDSE